MDGAGGAPEQVEEAIVGNARQAGGGPNPARQIRIREGVPQEVPAYTVNKACASGMKAIALGYQEILSGNLECVLAGGSESMSRVPYLLDQGRGGYRMGHHEPVDGMYRDGVLVAWGTVIMGEAGESQRHVVRRQAQALGQGRLGRLRPEGLAVRVILLEKRDHMLEGGRRRGKPAAGGGRRDGGLGGDDLADVARPGHGCMHRGSQRRNGQNAENECSCG